MPVRPKDHIEVIRPLLPSKYSPLRHDGHGLQPVYLAEISYELAMLLISLAGDAIPVTVPAIEPGPSPEVLAEEEEHLAGLEGRADIGEVERVQLVRARRGQGIFRTNVRLNESGCRVTGITDPAHLRASHIKPWKDCSDEEKVSGCNGLLLAPHVDHLFDRGWISFTDGGELIIAPGLSPRVVEAWHVASSSNPSPFNHRQIEFLEFHRQHILRSAL